MKASRTMNVFGACLLTLLCLCACERSAFDITGDWEFVLSGDGSEWGYDRSRATVWTLTGDQNEGEISADISFLSGSYQVRGKSITMEVIAGRGPMWFRRDFRGAITGDETMQGRYEGASIPLGEGEVETFTGTWWAIKKQ